MVYNKYMMLMIHINTVSNKNTSVKEVNTVSNKNTKKNGMSTTQKALGSIVALSAAVVAAKRTYNSDDCAKNKQLQLQDQQQNEQDKKLQLQQIEQQQEKEKQQQVGLQNFIEYSDVDKQQIFDQQQQLITPDDSMTNDISINNNKIRDMIIELSPIIRAQVLKMDHVGKTYGKLFYAIKKYIEEGQCDVKKKLGSNESIELYQKYQHHVINMLEVINSKMDVLKNVETCNEAQNIMYEYIIEFLYTNISLLCQEINEELIKQLSKIVVTREFSEVLDDANNVKIMK